MTPTPARPTMRALAAVAAVTAIAGAVVLGVRPQTVAPVVAAYPVGAEPDMSKTPGDVFPNITAEDVCAPGYAGRTRDVTEAEKAAVYREYGITTRAPGEYEIDHDASLELGGTNDIRNLWPQSYETQPYNAHVKDRYEDWLHAEVCAGRVTLPDAQFRITHDWIGHAKADKVIP